MPACNEQLTLSGRAARRRGDRHAGRRLRVQQALRVLLDDPVQVVAHPAAQPPRLTMPTNAHADMLLHKHTLHFRKSHAGN